MILVFLEILVLVLVLLRTFENIGNGIGYHLGPLKVLVLGIVKTVFEYCYWYWLLLRTLARYLRISLFSLLSEKEE